MLIVIGSCYSGCFITSTTNSISATHRIIITAAHDDQKRFSLLGVGSWSHSSDRFWGNLNKGLNIKDAFITGAWPGEWWHLWLDDNGDKRGNPPNNLGEDGDFAIDIRIGVANTENLKLTPWCLVWKHSPGELRVYDSQDRVTGLVNGEIKEEIPDSIYDEHNEVVMIFSPSGIYRYSVIGTAGGIYGLDIASIEGGGAIIFTATGISTTSGAVHQYTVDWDALARGEEGVTLKIDSNGDGTFERTITSGSELTGEDFGVVPNKQFFNHGPNPVPAEGCIFWLDLPDDTVDATLKIFDIDGALLVSISLDPLADRYPAAGRWAPEDDQGRLLGTGLYLYLVEIERTDGTVTYSPVQKMVIQR